MEENVEIKIVKNKYLEKIENDPNQNKEINEIKSKKKILKSLTFINVNYLDKCLEKIDSFPQINYLKIKSCQLKDKNYDLNINQLFPNVKELYLHNSLFNNETFNKNLIDRNLNNSFFPFHITKLYLTKNELINEELINILNKILSSLELVKNLKELSFAKNTISKVGINDLFSLPEHKFEKLELLDFNNNKIKKFFYNPSFMENLKILDLSDNLFSVNPFEEFKSKTLFILSGNTFLFENNSSQKYFNSLKKDLENFFFPISYLNLKGICNRFNRDLLQKFTLNNISSSIQKLDLSYCYLNNECLFEFLLNNKLENLLSLNLSGGEINEDFFQIFLDKKLNESFFNLTSLNLSDNKINLNDFNILYQFIYYNKKLLKLNLCKNFFFKDKYIVESKKQIENLPKLILSEGKIIINDFNSFINKLNKELILEKNFNLKFDCGLINNNLNTLSSNFINGEKIITKKKIIK